MRCLIDLRRPRTSKNLRPSSHLWRCCSCHVFASLITTNRLICKKRIVKPVIDYWKAFCRWNDKIKLMIPQWGNPTVTAAEAAVSWYWPLTPTVHGHCDDGQFALTSANQPPPLVTPITCLTHTSHTVHQPLAAASAETKRTCCLNSVGDRSPHIRILCRNVQSDRLEPHFE